MNELIIHFDLVDDKHNIPITQSIIIEQSISTIVEELNKVIFDKKLEVAVVVYPSEDGGHIKKIGIGLNGPRKSGMETKTHSTFFIFQYI